jgi:glycosyltransferase involved in cell wall biosynthesis
MGAISRRGVSVRISWLSYLDPFTFSGGGELHNRLLIEVGRRRGHEISLAPWLRGRTQRVVRRSGLAQRLRVDWSADMFVLANIRNHGPRRDRFPEAVVERVLATGRAVILADAWVDVCALHLPCDGQRVRCPATCSRAFANKLYGAAMGAVFVSPMQRRLIESVIDVPLPSAVIYSRPQIDTSLFRPLELERDIDVLYVGSINRAKGYDNLIKRFGPDRLTLVGPNHLDKPIEGNWLGPLANEKLPEIYNRAKTFAHLPSWMEPMGRTVVEAALCGCELVVNDRVGVTSYEPRDWREPSRVSRNATLFWSDLEKAVASVRSGPEPSPP